MSDRRSYQRFKDEFQSSEQSLLKKHGDTDEAVKDTKQREAEQRLALMGSLPPQIIGLVKEILFAIFFLLTFSGGVNMYHKDYFLSDNVLIAILGFSALPAFISLIGIMLHYVFPSEKRRTK